MTGAGANVLSAAGLVFALSSLCSPLRADVLPVAPPPLRLALELGAEHFHWREFGDDGRRLLTEQGPRYGAAVSLHNLMRREEGVLFALTLRGTTGVVDYDGQDSGGRFVASETAYGGYRLEAMGGYRFEPATAVRFFDVAAAVGLDRWERDIRSSRNAAGAAVSGLVEDYRIVYARFGIGAAHAGGPMPGYLSAGVHLPLSTRERVTVAGTPVTLAPGRDPSLFLAYRLSLRPADDGAPFGTYLRISYDSYRFKRSPVRAAGDLSVWQPESDMDVFGIALGFSY